MHSFIHLFGENGGGEQPATGIKKTIRERACRIKLESPCVVGGVKEAGATVFDGVGSDTGSHANASGCVAQCVAQCANIHRFGELGYLRDARATVVAGSGNKTIGINLIA